MWDDCDDFQGWTSASITYLDGVAIPYALDWTAALSVHYCAESDPALESLVESNLKRITLVLTSPSGHTFEFDTLRARAGTLLSVQAPASSVLSHASVLLTVDGDELGIGTRLHNQQEPD
jgi:hypothetical protein